MMKKLLVPFLFALAIILQSNSCKKNKTTETITTNCGCNAIDIQYQVRNLSGTLAYHTYTNKWYIFYQPTIGFFNNDFICNLTQDSVRSILANAPQTAMFNVIFSGKVKTVCSNEDFGIQQGNGTNYYIIIDSLKRN